MMIRQVGNLLPLPLLSAESVGGWGGGCTITASHRRQHLALTLIAVPDGVKVYVVLVVGEEKEAEPGVEGVDGNDEEDPHDVPLLPRRAVETQVHVDLGQTERDTLNIKYRKREFLTNFFSFVENVRFENKVLQVT